MALLEVRAKRINAFKQQFSADGWISWKKEMMFGIKQMDNKDASAFVTIKHISLSVVDSLSWWLLPILYTCKNNL